MKIPTLILHGVNERVCLFDLAKWKDYKMPDRNGLEILLRYHYFRGYVKLIWLVSHATKFLFTTLVLICCMVVPGILPVYAIDEYSFVRV